jgi:hypothetical protein
VGVIVREHYFQEHYRVVVIENDAERLYSIDVYKLLPTVPKGCTSWLDVGSPSRLCYMPLNESCEAVIVVTPERVEVVNLRFKTSIASDPYRGDAARAREECISALDKILG